MKTLKIFAGLFLISAMFIACDERDYDTPPLDGKTYTLDPSKTVVTIAELKEKFGQVAPMKIGRTEPNLVLKAYVVANDLSGNIYQMLYLQDETGGIMLGVSKAGLSLYFKEGQEVYVELDSVYIGKTGGVHQIGGLYNGNIGRLDPLDFDKSVFPNGLPSRAIIEQLTDTVKYDDLSSNVNKYVNTLVVIQDVVFDKGGLDVFCPQEGSNALPAGTHHQAINGISADMFAVRTSKYANFASDTLPTGTGTIRGILGRHSITWQFLLRSRNDIIGFPSK